MTGKFITLEGGEGVGKSTQLAFIENHLIDKGITVVVTREPGGTALGESIRDILLGDQYANMAIDTELLLMFAARAEHLDKVIKPAINKGHWVLCDRFTDATYAYQGGGRGIDESRIALLETWTQQGLTPDLTLLLDAPINVGMARASQRGKLDRFEQEKIQFFEKVRTRYLLQVQKYPQRLYKIDAMQSIDDVSKQINAILALCFA